MATVVLTPQTIAAGLRPAYWFVAQQAKEGDHIILYTREGKDSKEVRPDGHTNHFFYWSVKNAMFAGPGQVVVVELNAWFTGT